jgi:hypothetical protein
LKNWHIGFTLIMLLMIGINRASTLISLFAFSLFFSFYALRSAKIIDRSKRLAAQLKIYIFYISGMLAIPAFNFYQLSRRGEGWEVVAAIQAVGIPKSFVTYFENILSLYLMLTLFIIFICLIIYLVSRLASRLLVNNFTNISYYLSFFGIVVEAPVSKWTGSTGLPVPGGRPIPI